MYGKIVEFIKNAIMDLYPTIRKTSMENSTIKLVEHGVLVKHTSYNSAYYTRSDAK